jgi:hypothetical protein
MSEVKSTDNPDDRPQSDSEQQIDELSFSYLAAHPTVPNWRKKLESLLAGESSETLWRLGSVEQYIRVVIAESKVPLAQYHFSEALSQTIQNWNPLVMESADRLNTLLSLVAAFIPPVGFGKVLHYLNRSEGVKRTEEQVSGEYDLVDLYKKGLVALAQYYPTPPFHSYEDRGFAAYRELLDRNLKDERYGGYAAVRLHQLKVLDFDSQRFETLLLSSESVGVEVFRMLLDLADESEEKEAVGTEFGKILVTCARADEIERFSSLAASHGAVFNPEGDYQVFFPTLTLNDGVRLEIFLNMEDVKETALRYYIKYSSEKVHELLTGSELNKNKISRYISGYLEQVTSQPVALNALVKELLTLNAQLRISNNSFVLTVPREGLPRDIVLKLGNNAQNELLKWRYRTQSPVKAKEYDFATA